MTSYSMPSGSEGLDLRYIDRAQGTYHKGLARGGGGGSRVLVTSFCEIIVLVNIIQTLNYEKS